MLEQFKPPFISRIYFKDFTFGGAPIELDNLWVDSKTRDKVIMEVDMRWSAETANIALAVDMLGSSDLTRLVVRVQDVALSGTARITFQPLIDEYPGFGAMTVALMGASAIRFFLLVACLRQTCVTDVCVASPCCLVGLDDGDALPHIPTYLPCIVIANHHGLFQASRCCGTSPILASWAATFPPRLCRFGSTASSDSSSWAC